MYARKGWEWRLDSLWWGGLESCRADAVPLQYRYGARWLGCLCGTIDKGGREGGWGRPMGGLMYVLDIGNWGEDVIVSLMLTEG